jgi:hypothetical protein
MRAELSMMALRSADRGPGLPLFGGRYRSKVITIVNEIPKSQHFITARVHGSWVGYDPVSDLTSHSSPTQQLEAKGSGEI